MRAETGTQASLERLFSLSGKVAVVTGATGVLGGAMARGLARVGARVGVLGRREERAEEVAREILGSGGEAMPLPAYVLNEERLPAAREAVLDRWGQMDILVNAAGGNVPGATLSVRFKTSARAETLVRLEGVSPSFRHLNLLARLPKRF